MQTPNSNFERKLIKIYKTNFSNSLRLFSRFLEKSFYVKILKLLSSLILSYWQIENLEIILKLMYDKILRPLRKAKIHPNGLSSGVRKSRAVRTVIKQKPVSILELTGLFICLYIKYKYILYTTHKYNTICSNVFFIDRSRSSK